MRAGWRRGTRSHSQPTGAATSKALETADPAANHGRSARAVSDFRYRMSKAGTSGLLLFAIVGGVVLLSIVNVAHLLLARGLARGSRG